MPGLRPSYGFLFASPGVDLGAALSVARDMTGAEIVGASTAGQFTEDGLSHAGLAMALVGGEVTTRAAFASGLRLAPERVGKELTAGLGDAKREASARSHRHLTTVLLTDGLAGAGERLLGQLYEGRVHNSAQFVGGAAGDEGRFAATYVGAGDRASTDSAAVLHVFGERPWGVGIGHGLQPASKPMKVTRAEANVVYEIGGEPAFTVYQRHAASRGVKLTAENAGPYLIENELGIHFFEKVTRARAPLSVGADGSLSCAADIPRGSMVSILTGEPDSMVRAAQGAAKDARIGLGGAEPAGVILFDCVCRGMILKKDFNREIEAVRTVFPNVPVVGFLTYGEIARSNELREGWHNTTAVVVAIPA
jgi:methyl-accepting chemotaxis protein